MLKQRVITALLMMATFLSVLLIFPEYVFFGFLSVVLLVAAWEWADLASLSGAASRLAYVGAAAIASGAVLWYLGWPFDADRFRLVSIVAGTWWALALLWIQSYPSSAIIWGARPMRLLMGLVVMIPAWLACLYLRAQIDGQWLVLFLVLLVAGADVGAYFVGRKFGRRKLAPRVSPGKSWEGVLGGLVFSVLVCAVFYACFGGELWKLLLLVVIPAALVSVVGDLLESMVKRHRGVKDSSQLLPGHGGVLDRVDGLLAAAPVFALLVAATAWSLQG